MPFSPGDHPEDPFVAYALGSLDEDELADVEAHLDAFPRDGEILAPFIETTSMLAAAAPQATPPHQLQAQVIAAVEELPPVFAPHGPGEETPGAKTADAEEEARDSSSRFTFSSFALPLAATLVIGLLSASLIMNVVTTTRINTLEQERLASNSRIAELEAGQSRVGDQISQLGRVAAGSEMAMKQMMETNYLMARPFTQPLLLRPTDGSSDSEGVLLVNNDGREAILMLSNMDRSRPSQSYQVWLGRNGQQFPIGEIAVDSSGWGTMALKPPESLYGFDWINLTVDEPRTGGGSSGEMVLQTRIISPGDR